MDKKSINFALLLVTTLAIFSVLPMVSAATLTINSPAADSTITGNRVDINISMSDFTGHGRGVRVNLSFYAMSSSTANNTWMLLGTNNTVNFTTLASPNMTMFAFFPRGLEDSNDYIINVTAINETGSGSTVLASDTNTGVTINLGVPTAPSSLTAGKLTDTTPILSGTVLGSNTTGCTLYFLGANPGNNNYAMTHSGSNCTYQFTSAISSLSYIYYITATDGTDTAYSANTTLEIDSGNAGANSGSQVSSAGKDVVGVDSRGFTIVEDKKGTIDNPFVVVVLVIVAISFIFFFFNKKKK